MNINLIKNSRKCIRCTNLKTVDNFSQNNLRIDGLSVWCKDCYRDYRQQKRELISEYHKEYYLKNKEHELARGRIWKENNKDRRRQEWNSYYQKNKENIDIRVCKWKKENREKVISWVTRWQRENQDKKRLYGKKWRENHIEYFENNKEHHKLACRLWTLKNPEKHNATQAKRRASKLFATPRWANNEAIGKVYLEAVRLTRETGIKHVVDHIVPLQGKNVSGLHVENNLRAIPEIENLKKGNRHFHDTKQGGYYYDRTSLDGAT
jgi:hypothetical protein